jgi:hypothetical protein
MRTRGAGDTAPGAASVAGWRGQAAQADQLKAEAGDPQHEPGQGRLVWQFGAKDCRVRPHAYLTVVEFRLQHAARLPSESDLIRP